MRDDDLIRQPVERMVDQTEPKPVPFVIDVTGADPEDLARLERVIRNEAERPARRPD